jgi:hypothetical protein
MANGDDSNPIWLYLLLDRAVDQGAVNNAKIKDVRANLMRAVAKELRATGRKAEVADAVAAIRIAPLGMFMPQLWRLDVAKIAGRYISGTYYSDEYLISDLVASEFETIVD